MCELFGISSDYPIDESQELNTFRLRGGQTADNPDGWGLAWWDTGKFQLSKEPTPAYQSALFAHLCETMRSRLVISHVRKAKFPPIRAMSNTHPFQRVCCGKEWVFAHNDMVADIVDMELSSDNPVCRPLGETDSEYAFCHLLGHIAQHFDSLASAAPTAWFENLATASGVVASLGKFNFLMSDGEHLIAYGHDRLHYLERPNAGQPNDPPATVNSALVATEPLDENEGWLTFKPGELRIYRSGRMIGRMMTHAIPPNESSLPMYE